MIYFNKEGDQIRHGLTFQKISDGGVSLKLRVWKDVYYARIRGSKSKIKPRILFGRINAQNYKSYETFMKGN